MTKESTNRHVELPYLYRSEILKSNLLLLGFEKTALAQGLELEQLYTDTHTSLLEVFEKSFKDLV